MDIRNDEMIIWKDKAHMLVNGPSAIGEFVITNKRMAFIASSDRTLFSGKTKSNLWDIAIERVQDIDLHELNGTEHPVVRIHYAEDDNYFTFPRCSPRSSIAAIRLFVNSARRIEKEMDMMRGVGRSLKEDTLVADERLPELIKEIPHPADQICFQCGKEMQEPSIPDPDDISSCAVCEVSVER